MNKTQEKWIVSFWIALAISTIIINVFIAIKAKKINDKRNEQNERISKFIRSQDSLLKEQWKWADSVKLERLKH